MDDVEAAVHEEIASTLPPHGSSMSPEGMPSNQNPAHGQSKSEDGGKVKTSPDMLSHTL